MAENKSNKSTEPSDQEAEASIKTPDNESEEHMEDITETEQEDKAPELDEDTDAEPEAEVEESIEKQLEISEKALKESNDRLLRQSAEFDNYKKRMTRETEEFRKYSNEVLIKQLLTVVDNLERAIESSKTEEISATSIIEGVEMTHKEIIAILGKFNVTPIECVEKPFDPEFHQAVSQEETDDMPENTVVNELMKGYTLHDRLIRPSMVVVSKAKTKKEKKKINEKV